MVSIDYQLVLFIPCMIMVDGECVRMDWLYCDEYELTEDRLFRR